MNRELIDRIDRLLSSYAGGGKISSTDGIVEIMRDCKAALSQAEPVSEPSELEMHRADYKAIKAAGFDSPGELLAAYNTLTKSVPQDVEEFIADKSIAMTQGRMVDVDHLRAWMAGHARCRWSSA